MLPLIGWRERVAFPDLDILEVTAKIDTGARSSCLHAFHIEVLERQGETYVRFGVHPNRRDTAHEVWCELPLLDRRVVKSSSGDASVRYFVETTVRLGDTEWPIELSLADRETMGYRMLLGRTAVAGRFMIDVARSFLRSRRPKKRKKKKKKKDS